MHVGAHEAWRPKCGGTGTGCPARPGEGRDRGASAVDSNRAELSPKWGLLAFIYPATRKRAHIVRAIVGMTTASWCMAWWRWR